MIALGGNALQKPKEKGTLENMMRNCDVTAVQIANILERGYEIVLTHGNGPQVGSIFLQNEIAAGSVDPQPLFACGAESQGLIGFALQNSLHNELVRRNSPFKNVPVVTLVSQVIVDPADPGFKNPSKPVGKFYTKEEAEEIAKTKGKAVKEDAGRGWRVVVPSPMPQGLVEAEAVKSLLHSGALVIASGGGGIPVTIGADGMVRGIDAVIDKDLAAERLAAIVEADKLLILTDVECAYTGYTTSEKKALGDLALAEAKALHTKGEFAAGSMGPKIKAAMLFAERTGHTALITSLDKACDALDGKVGTRIHS